MNRKDYLIVVDMQRGFLQEANPAVVPAVASCIESAPREGREVLFVEFDGWGPTISELSDLAPDAPRICKWRNDGSDQIARHLTGVEAFPESFGNHRFMLCGVNRCACVLETALGLTDLGRTALILMPATSCNCRDDSSCRIECEAFQLKDSWAWRRRRQKSNTPIFLESLTTPN